MVLTPKQRLAYDLARQGKPQTEIARMLRLRPESVCRLLRRARTRIRSVERECSRGLVEAVLA